MRKLKLTLVLFAVLTNVSQANDLEYWTSKVIEAQEKNRKSEHERNNRVWTDEEYENFRKCRKWQCDNVREESSGYEDYEYKLYLARKRARKSTQDWMICRYYEKSNDC